MGATALIKCRFMGFPVPISAACRDEQALCNSLSVPSFDLLESQMVIVILDRGIIQDLRHLEHDSDEDWCPIEARHLDNDGLMCLCK